MNLLSSTTYLSIIMTLIQGYHDVILLYGLKLLNQMFNLTLMLAILLNEHLYLCLLLFNRFISFLNLLSLFLHLVYAFSDLPLQTLLLLLSSIIFLDKLSVLSLSDFKLLSQIGH